MTVDLEADKQDFPQPSDLSTFVNETKFNSPTEGKQGIDHPAPHPALENTVPSPQGAQERHCTAGYCTPAVHSSQVCILKQPMTRNKLLLNPNNAC
jgi:hypothetical protein